MSDRATSPIMQSPLHTLGLPAKAQVMDASRGVWANEIPLLGYILLRGNAGDTAFNEATSRALRLRLPSEPCTFVQSGSMTVLWLSPDEWMIILPRPDHAALMKSLKDELSGIRSQVTDNSGGYTQILIQGRNSRDVLSHCTVYNLDHLEDGRVAGTTFGKTSAYLRRAGDGYCLLIRRSFAGYIWLFLERAAQPYKFGIAKLDRGSEAAP